MDGPANTSPNPKRAAACAALWLLTSLPAWLVGGCATRDPGLYPSLPGLTAPDQDRPFAVDGAQAPPGAVDEDTLMGDATWYGDRFHGRLTANGEVYNMHAFTAAHRSLPFNTVVRVVHRKTLRSVVVRINDRGPRRQSRVIDLSRAAAEEMDMMRSGVVPVYLEILSWGDGARYRDGRRVRPKRRASHR